MRLLAAFSVCLCVLFAAIPAFALAPWLNDLPNNKLAPVLVLIHNKEYSRAAEVLAQHPFAEFAGQLQQLDYPHQLLIFEMIANMPVATFLHGGKGFPVYRSFWDGVATAFAVTEGHENLRHASARKILDAVLAMPDHERRRQVITHTIAVLQTATFQGTGEERFAPLALTLINWLNGRNAFDPSAIPASDTKLRELLEIHLFYGVPDRGPFRYEAGWDPQRNPTLTVPINRGKAELRWLDIASGPKANGSMPLNLLKDAAARYLPGTKIRFTGTDICFPVYAYDNGQITDSPFAALVSGQASRVEVNGATYLQGLVPENNVMDEAFCPEDGARYDFISLCKAIHHMKGPGEEVSPRPMAQDVSLRTDGKTLRAPIRWVNDTDSPIAAPAYPLAPSQQRVVENLLGRLDNGGVLFLELSLFNACTFNDDQFIVVQRLDDTTFRIYTQTIPYEPHHNEVYPYIDWLLDGKPAHARFGCEGLFKTCPEAFHDRLRTLMRRADFVVSRYERLDHGVWRYMQAAVAAVREGRTLEEVFRAYLATAPEEDVKKREILAEAAALAEEIRDYLSRDPARAA